MKIVDIEVHEISTEYWDDDGTAEFAQMKSRLVGEGMVLEKGD